mgnify:CR=1
HKPGHHPLRTKTQSKEVSLGKASAYLFSLKRKELIQRMKSFFWGGLGPSKPSLL